MSLPLRLSSDKRREYGFMFWNHFRFGARWIESLWEGHHVGADAMGQSEEGSRIRADRKLGDDDHCRRCRLHHFRIDRVVRTV